jgi:hypothetical protein
MYPGEPEPSEDYKVLKTKHWVVVIGFRVGVFDTWERGAQLAVTCCPSADHRAYKSYIEAVRAFKRACIAGTARIVPFTLSTA